MKPKFTVLAVFALIRMRQEGTLESDAARWLEQESGRQGQEFHPEGPEIVAGVYHPDETAARAMPGDPVFAGATGQFGRPEPGHGDFEQPSRIPFDPTGGGLLGTEFSDVGRPLTPDEADRIRGSRTLVRGEAIGRLGDSSGVLHNFGDGVPLSKDGVVQTSELDPVTGQRMTRPVPDDGNLFLPPGRRAPRLNSDETPLTPDQIAALGTRPDRFINDDVPPAGTPLTAEELARMPIPHPNVGHPELPGDRAAALDSGFTPRDVRDVLDPTDSRTQAEKDADARGALPGRTPASTADLLDESFRKTRKP